MTRYVPLVLLFVCLVASPDSPPMPDAVLEVCLTVDQADHLGRLPVSIDPVAGRVQVMERGPLSPYDLFLPDGDNRVLRIGFASGNPAGGDYLFVNSHRGYLDHAILLSLEATPRLQRPRQAAFAMLGYHGQRYLCLMETHGPRQRSVFVARIPARMGAELRLFYKQMMLP